MSGPAFQLLPDLALRSRGGAVVHASDESFAERENLIKPGAAGFDPAAFGHKGKIYDGWETRRRRDQGHDHAVVRLAVPGVVHGVVVDTAHFTGNHPPEVSVEGAGFEGHPSTGELGAAEWTTLVPRTAVAGDTANAFAVEDPHRYTHVRLNIHPDGGVARLRVHGEALPDPRLLVTESMDLAALVVGGRVLACSNGFYGAPENAIAPGRARHMGEGWENARRRGAGNDHLEIGLAAAGEPRLLEVDTSYFLHNAPAEAAVSGNAEADGTGEWFPLLERTPLLPDTPHMFVVAAPRPAERLRLDVYPDGGVARFRAHGPLTAAGRAALWVRWLDALPEDQARAALAGLGLSHRQTESLLRRRPVGTAADLPEPLAAAVRG
ncbi:allantoicase [Streptomonospora alba]|uniref:Probable allantoicase n=1 Tax=Streptomonospora alba TaxID=183763 RepID=A0A0C2FGX5_9ACTN|nr:allantoicase [Streptomonospora alba]KIH98529.1 allantoicase [Streptomonospora alba]